MFSAVTAIICFFVSLPRTLDQLSALGIFSAVTMGIAILLVMIFSGIQDHPFGFDGTSPVVTAFPVKGTTYVAGCTNISKSRSIRLNIIKCRDVCISEYQLYTYRSKRNSFGMLD